MTRKSTHQRDFEIENVMEALRREVKRWPTPAVTVYSQRKASPYQILISTIISLRTQDKTTAEASARLFRLARTPEAMVRRRPATIAKAIYPAGFYRTKAETIREVSRVILAQYEGQVPDEVEELIKLKGVGRKTANLVVTLGYGKPGICVDTHVHRICNRWGYVETEKPEQTEMALRGRLPLRFWIPINDWLVALGQNLCKPISPLCSQCRLARWCARRGVARSR